MRLDKVQECELNIKCEVDKLNQTVVIIITGQCTVNDLCNISDIMAKSNLRDYIVKEIKFDKHTTPTIPQTEIIEILTKMTEKFKGVE